MANTNFTIVGMVPTGEACLVRDGDGRFWVSSLYAPPAEVPAEDVDEYLAARDWTRVGRSFETWGELDRYREQSATPAFGLFPNIADYEDDDVWDALDESRTASAPEEVAAARLLLIDILRYAEVVKSDDELYDAVLGRLTELNSTHRSVAVAPPTLLAAMNRFAA